MFSSSPITATLAAAPWVVDEIFPDNNWWSYKLDATTLSLTAGYNYAFSSTRSIDVSLMYYDTAAYLNTDYDGVILQLGYMHRF